MRNKRDDNMNTQKPDAIKIGLSGGLWIFSVIIGWLACVITFAILGAVLMRNTYPFHISAITAIPMVLIPVAAGITVCIYLRRYLYRKLNL